MAKGFTLLELMIVMLLISFTLTFTLSNWQYNQERQFLQKEQQRLLLFLKQIQTKAEMTNQSWFLIVSNDHFSNQWCLSAQKQNTQICDCLHLSLCNQEIFKKIYFPESSSQVQLISTKYYPNKLTFFSGKRNTSLSARITLKTEHYQSILSLNNIGIMRLKGGVMK